MKEITFEWNGSKNLTNQKKHKISFEEAQTIFYDDNARLIHDPEHSDDEDRFILLGLSSTLRLLVVVHTYSKQEEIIRIISARKATKNEIKKYLKGE
jgi:uncharacterized DUF497 family protein